MSKCTQCPHDVGDTRERDCSFPDCVGGWEKAFNDLSKHCQSLTQQLEDRWISVDDRLPEEDAGKMLMAYGEPFFGKITIEIDCGYYEEGKWHFWVSDNTVVGHGVTHWQPLPPKP